MLNGQDGPRINTCECYGFGSRLPVSSWASSFTVIFKVVIARQSDVKKTPSLQSIPFCPSAAATAKSLQSCPTLCDPRDGSPSGSPVPGILQARTLGWVAILLQCMKVKSESEVAQQCPTLSDPMGCSLPGSSVHGIFQARVLEWGAIAFSVCQSTCLKYLLIQHIKKQT